MINKFFIVFIVFFCSGCGIYSFTGTSIDYTKTKTIYIQQYENISSSGPPEMANVFSEKTRDFYQQNTNLELVNNENADLQLYCKIVGYETRPQAAQANEVAALYRLTIRVNAEFVNLSDEKQNFTQDFSFFKDYDQNKNLSDVENEYIDEISEQIILDIFNKSVANW